MKNERRTEALSKALRSQIRTFSRIEKAFYGSIVLTFIVMAVSIVYLQSHNYQLQEQINTINDNISSKQTELDNAKQEVNELTSRDRIVDIANQAGLSNQQDNIQKVN